MFPNSSRPGIGLKPAAKASVRSCRSTHGIAPCWKLAARSVFSFIPHSPTTKRTTSSIWATDGINSCTSCAAWRQIAADLLDIRLTAGGQRRHYQRPCRVPFRLADLRGAQDGAHVRRARRSGTPAGGVSFAARRISRRRRMGHELHADLQHDRAPVAPMLVVASRPTGTRTKPSSATCCSRARRSLARTPCRSAGVFVPREEITFRECSDEELAEIKQSKGGVPAQEVVPHAHHAVRLQNSPHYAP